jgi:hypothetical protein
MRNVQCLDTGLPTMPSVDVPRRTRRNVDTIRGLAWEVAIRCAVTDRMGARPYRTVNIRSSDVRARQSSRPWIYLTELKGNYTVRDILVTADKIGDDVSVLVVVHPQGIGDEAQFAGQYGGGAEYNSTLAQRSKQPLPAIYSTGRRSRCRWSSVTISASWLRVRTQPIIGKSTRIPAIKFRRMIPVSRLLAE